jgi:peptidyl-tRNA hydrolase, PTH1 family
MSFYLLALGNPGEDYENTRHSVGRFIIRLLAEEHEFSGWSAYKKKKLETNKGTIHGVSSTLILIDEFMNVLGRVGGPAIKAGIPSKAIVFHDDLDIPIGSFKISYGKGAGGHKGVESLIKNLKTKKFFRMRIGISPKTPSGKIKKIKDREKVRNYVLGEMPKKEKDLLKKIFPKINDAVVSLVTGKTKVPVV